VQRRADREDVQWKKMRFTVESLDKWKRSGKERYCHVLVAFYSHSLTVGTALPLPFSIHFPLLLSASSRLASLHGGQRIKQK
jgi:hypothetical protein